MNVGDIVRINPAGNFSEQVAPHITGVVSNFENADDGEEWWKVRWNCPTPYLPKNEYNTTYENLYRDKDVIVIHDGPIILEDGFSEEDIDRALELIEGLS